MFRFMGLQAVIQGLAVAAALLVVRTLTKEQYGWYSVASAMLAAIPLLSDSGGNFALNAIGGKVYGDRGRFLRLVVYGGRMRRSLAIVVMPLIGTLAWWMLWKQAAPAALASGLVALLLVSAWFELSAGVLVVALQLDLQAAKTQRLNAFMTSLRLVCLALAAQLSVLSAAVALLVNALAALARSMVLRSWMPRPTVDHAATDGEDRAVYRRIVWTTLPNAIFFSVQGQITILLGGIFTRGDTIADLGALGRFAIIINIFFVAMNSLVVPKLARCQDTVRLRSLISRYLAWVAIIAAGLVAIFSLFSEQMLWLIGPKYAALQPEMALMGVNLTAWFLVHAIFAVNSARAWIRYTSFANIPLTIACQIALLFVLDVRSVHGVIVFAIFSLVPNLLLVLLDLNRGLRRPLPEALP